MKESYRKGLASHPGPESCVASREAALEALTGAHAGRVLNCEIIATECRRRTTRRKATPAGMPSPRKIGSGQPTAGKRNSLYSERGLGCWASHLIATLKLRSFDGALMILSRAWSIRWRDCSPRRS